MKKLKFLMPFVAMAVTMFSCSNDEWQDEVTVEEVIPHCATMRFNSSVPTFEGTGTRADSDWKNGDKVYLQFTSGIYGVATYSATNSEWNILCYGTLTATDDGTCEAYYFENVGEIGHTTVALTNSTIVYTDKAASYSLENNELTVTANLKPMTGRIRFKGTKANQEYSVEGTWLVCTNYDFTTNTFTKERKTINSKTNKDTYSDYIYCLYPENEDDDEEGMEIICNDKASNTSFTRTLNYDVLTAGKSGYLDIPTTESARGWSAIKYKDFTISGVTFRMMRVVAGTDDIPYSYYIGESEVTEALYHAVMNGSASNPQYPIKNVSYDGFQSFITGLNEKTDSKFRLPSGAEWQFAAKGGHLSKGYTYSGSNTADDVAWYSENSGGTVHNVKTKLPNEIGIYDMSGNVSEWTSDPYRPVGSSAYYYYYYGGAYNNFQTMSYISYSNSASNNIGIRLACD